MGLDMSAKGRPAIVFCLPQVIGGKSYFFHFTVLLNCDPDIAVAETMEEVRELIAEAIASFILKGYEKTGIQSDQGIHPH